MHKPEALIRGTRQLQEPLKVEFKLVLVLWRAQLCQLPAVEGRGEGWVVHILKKAVLN